MSSLLSDRFSKTVFPFALWKNMYLSDRELGDEYRYVFDRKYAERATGNTLDRPKLLMKRNFIQSTEIRQEVLSQGRNYQANQLMQKQQIQPMMQQMAQPAYHMSNKQKFSQNVAGNSYQTSSSPNRVEEMLIQSGVSESQILEFQNFLKHSPLTKFNLIPSKEGVISFSANLKPFTQLFVFALDLNSSALSRTDLPFYPIQKRDLSLTVPLDSAKGFSESRTAMTLLKGQMHEVEDITSTEIQLIDDLTKVKGVLEELIRANSQSNSGVFSSLNFIEKWHSFDLEEKNKKFSEFTCHELNIFLYFKDRKYFEAVVRSFLEYKMEKTFVDFYLLGQSEIILRHNTLSGLKTLNALEKCFLVDTLMKANKKEEAQRIVEFMRNTCSAQENKDSQYYNRMFDIVLNLNMLQPQNGGGISTVATHSAHPAFDDFNFSDLHETGISNSNNYASDPFSAFGNFAVQNQMPMGFGGMGGNMYNHNAMNMNLLSNSLPTVPMYSPQQQFQQHQQQQQRAMPQSDLFCDFAGYGGEQHFQNAYNEELMMERNKIRMNYEEMENTNEYMETHYFKVKKLEQFANLIQINSFWVDYAEFLVQESSKGFLSGNFWRTYNESVSCFMALALLDLPFEATPHEFKSKDRGIEITPSNSLIMFKKEVKEAPLDLKNEVMVTHRYVAHGSSSSTEESIPDEFLSNKVYECEVIMTNASPQQKEVTLLYQVPQCSLPLAMSKYMKSIVKSLSPYSTDKFQFQFYFPSAGTFLHFPTNIARGAQIVARANENLKLKVVRVYTVAKKETFRDIVQGGSKEEVLEFLRVENLIARPKGFDFSYMLWMLKDRAFFAQVVQILRDKLFYEPSVWQYAFYHRGDEETLKEYFVNSKPSSICSKVGRIFTSKLLTLTAEESGLKHLDYYPMINARFHSIGNSVQQWSLNKNFKATYEKFLTTMIEAKKLSVVDKMMFSYNLQLQDRISEAIQVFKQIDLNELQATEENALQIQYDYMNAYYDFYTGANESFKIARSVVRKYEDYPVISWRMLFLQILHQLNEFDGEADEDLDLESEDLSAEQKLQNYKKSIKLEPTLNVDLIEHENILKIESANIKKVIAKFYIIDIEILFSRTPFLKDNTEEFSYVKPCHVVEKLISQTQEAQQQKVSIEIPEDLQSKNMVIEINGEGIQVFKSFYKSQLKVNIIQSFGELKVTNLKGQALPQIYVKVFYQKKGQGVQSAAFFKDGYTDIRGKFEYSQTNGNKVKDVEKFAILVMSDTLGSVIKECNPPKVEDVFAGSSRPAIVNTEANMSQQKMTRLLNCKKAK